MQGYLKLSWTRIGNVEAVTTADHAHFSGVFTQPWPRNNNTIVKASAPPVYAIACVSLIVPPGHTHTPVIHNTYSNHNIAVYTTRTPSSPSKHNLYYIGFLVVNISGSTLIVSILHNTSGYYRILVLGK